ncbi:MAG: helix-turn-helix transcriptional regulator [Bacteriovorax sp.]|jgi:DNA-binding CsgD family transcriptional regulator
MNTKERNFIAIILISIIIMAALDLVNDFMEGVAWWHIVSEGLVILIALVGIFSLMRGSFSLKHSLEEEKQSSKLLRFEAEKWRVQSKKYLEGLSHAIDAQLTNWELTASEREVAFLLLKGLSLKEIADIRKTTEKTARSQSIAIYSKSGLNGRSELAAFFLEDLLPAQVKENIEVI